MKNLSIILNEDYRSFKKGYTVDLEGDFIIISGINGAGKSQLLNLIRAQEFKIEAGRPNIPMDPDNLKTINSNIEINSNKVLPS